MVLRSVLWALGCALLVACGGSSDGGVDSGSGGGGSDCDVAASLAPAFGGADQTAFESGSGTSGADPHYMQYLGRLDGDAKYDQLVIELAAGIGTYDGTDIAPKSIALTGDETQYRTCGACVRVLADVDEDATSVGQYYMATGGTLDVTSTSDQLEATLTDVTFVEVAIGSDFTSTPTGSCATAVPALAISAHIDLHQ